MVRNFKALGSGLLSCVLVACGGGSAPVPGPIELQAQIRTNNVAIAWNPVIASQYALYSAEDGGEFEFAEFIGAAFSGAMITTSVHLYDWTQELSYRLEGCNLNDCSVSNEVKLLEDYNHSAIGYFKASNAEVTYSDRFGTTVDIEKMYSPGIGIRAVVGAPYEDTDFEGIVVDFEADDDLIPPRDGAAPESGAVYGYWMGGADPITISDDRGYWLQTTYIKAPDITTYPGDDGDIFGTSVSISGDGNYLAVGAPLEDGGCTYPDIDNPDVCVFDVSDNSVKDAGAVFVYQSGGNGTWVYITMLKPEVPLAGAEFGYSLDFNYAGSRLVVGAPYDTACLDGVDPCDDDVANAGAVYVFDASGGTWVQSAAIVAPNADPDDAFGESVAIDYDGFRVVVGAPGEDGEDVGITAVDSPDIADATPKAGAAYVFFNVLDDDEINFIWDIDAYLKGDGSADSGFGEAIGLSAKGNDLIVGAPDSEAAFVFLRTDDGDTDPDDGDGWVDAPQKLEAGNPDDGDAFGSAVAILNIDDPDASGELVEYYGLAAVGAPYEEGSGVAVFATPDDTAPAGAVYLFTQATEDSVWLQEVGDYQDGYIKSGNTAFGYSFGSDVALNNDGTKMFIGAPGEDCTDGIVGPPITVIENPPPAYPTLVPEYCTPGSATESGAAYLY